MTTNVLILCTGNSARSVLAEGMLNTLAGRLGRDVRAFSAGSQPAGAVNPAAVDVLRAAGADVTYFRSKSWDEFSGEGKPSMRIVITVCDSAAQETCPYWPGSPVVAHWGYPDPSHVQGTGEEKRAAFELTRQALAYRLMQLLALPLESMSDRELTSALTNIANS